MSGADSGKSLEEALFGDAARRGGGEGAERARLRGFRWDVSYSHEDGDPVAMFFVPALERAALYQRATGYFSAGVLAMAARGLDKLIERGGRMELLVGCTLGDEEIEQIQEGYDVREAVARATINRLALERAGPEDRERLGYLAWMIAHGHLDVKVAIPKDADGHFRAGLGLYHSKVGIVTDDAGDVLVFKGSINETPAGWQQNTEDFDVNCSWVGGSDLVRVEKAAGDFAKLWAGRARSTAVMDLPEAVKQELMRYMPRDATFVAPPPDPEEEGPPAAEEAEEPAAQQTLEERREEVWSFIRQAPAREDGALVAVETSAVEPWPHQLRAYKRMLESWPFRLLIADEVGLGKTIEAGMILRHAWISGLAKRILILTPAGVMRQWQAELYEKFNLRAPMYTGSKLVWPDYHGRVGELERPVDRASWAAEPLVLASSHLVRRKERQRELIEAEDWDLLVLDEAHHARRRGPGTAQEGGANRLLRLMQEIGPKAKSLLMMTATPMQVHPVELWDLLSVLGLPEAWNRHAFIEYFEKLAKNPDHETLHQLAGLFRAGEAMYGPASEAEVKPIAENVGVASEIGQRKVLTALRDGKSTIPLKRLSTSHRKLAVGVMRSMSPIQRLMSRHTRNLLRRYHEAGLLSSPIAHREPIDEPVEMNPKERAVYEAVEKYISQTYRKASGAQRPAVGFVMTIYRRRVASSFQALRQTLTTRLRALQAGGTAAADGQGEIEFDEDVSQDELAEEVMSTAEASLFKDQALQAEEEERIRGLLKDIAKLGADSKARKLKHHLSEGEASGYDSAIVFTQYTDTLDYLKDYLADDEAMTWPIGCYSGRGGEVRDVSGRWQAVSKEEIKRRLREREVRLLICTDAAGEGLNLQTCGLLINYDLPWNPMKVEQRIGRIDRIGQRYETVRVVNLGYADTVETDVYFSLNNRINLIQGLVGKMQPILSRLPRMLETAALEGEEEATRHKVKADVLTMVDEADADGFDIDAVADNDLTVPAFPASPLRLEQIEAVLRSAELLPPGYECNPLEAGSFKLLPPGTTDSIRVTAKRDLFAEQFCNHQFMTHGGPAMEEMMGSIK